MDYFYATESLKYDARDYADLAEQLMEEIADNIWCQELELIGAREATYKETRKIHKLIKAKYDEYKIACPTEYLTKTEHWDIIEKNHDDHLASGGYDNEIESIVSGSTYQLKKSKFKSKYYGDFGTGAFDDK